MGQLKLRLLIGSLVGAADEVLGGSDFSDMLGRFGVRAKLTVLDVLYLERMARAMGVPEAIIEEARAQADLLARDPTTIGFLRELLGDMCT